MEKKHYKWYYKVAIEEMFKIATQEEVIKPIKGKGTLGLEMGFMLMLGLAVKERYIQLIDECKRLPLNHPLRNEISDLIVAKNEVFGIGF